MDEVALHPAFEPLEPTRLSLGVDDLHVWAVPLSGDAEPHVAVLSANERERAARFHFADHRRRYEIGHGALRRILGAYLGRAPQAVEFVFGPRGKPFLAESLAGHHGPYFSLSHSGKLALIGVASAEIGVDCEKVRRLESYVAIAEKHFSRDEFAGLMRVPEAERLFAFYRCWTRKEAYIKALGEGLAMALDTFDVSLGDEPKFLACRDGRENPADWSMLDVSPGPEFTAAAALRTTRVDVQRFRLPLA